MTMIQYYAEDKDKFSFEASVYSLKPDSWRWIEKFPYCRGYKADSGVFISGAFHWIVGQNRGYGSTSTGAKLIVAFNLKTEEYWLALEPQYSDKNFHMDVCGLGGCLCVICNSFKRYVDMWVKKDYGVEKSWTKLFSIAQPDVIGYFHRRVHLADFSFRRRLLFGFTKTRELQDGRSSDSQKEKYRYTFINFRTS
ncbi:hypothetical protein LguiA_013181 [Lonicera macranthoides]